MLLSNWYDIVWMSDWSPSSLVVDCETALPVVEGRGFRWWRWLDADLSRVKNIICLLIARVSLVARIWLPICLSIFYGIGLYADVKLFRLGSLHKTLLRVCVCVCVCVCVSVCVFPSTINASPDWNKTISVVPEIRPAMLRWRNYSVSSTFVVLL